MRIWLNFHLSILYFSRHIQLIITDLSSANKSHLRTRTAPNHNNLLDYVRKQVLNALINERKIIINYY